MIYILGVCHGVQFIKDCYDDPQDEETIKDFGNYIKEIINKFNIDLIIEEMNCDALKRNKAESYIALIAKELNIKHEMCDPSKEERNQENIKNDDERENYWISKIKKYEFVNAIFIFGHDHKEAVKRKLENNNFKSKLLSEECFGKEMYPGYKVEEWLRGK